MIAFRKSKATLLRLVPPPPEPPSVDLDRVSVDGTGVHFRAGALKHTEHVWFLDERSGRKVSAVRFQPRGVDVLIDGCRKSARYTLYLAGHGGWTELTLEGGFRSVRPALPHIDGSGIGFSEVGFYCREPSVIGYHRVTLSVRHPVGGAERKLKLDVDTLRGTFDTGAYLGLNTGDRVRLEFTGGDGTVLREFCFPQANDPWATYSLDQLTRS